MRGEHCRRGPPRVAVGVGDSSGNVGGAGSADLRRLGDRDGTRGGGTVAFVRVTARRCRRLSTMPISPPDGLARAVRPGVDRHDQQHDGAQMEHRRQQPRRDPALGEAAASGGEES